MNNTNLKLITLILLCGLPIKLQAQKHNNTLEKPIYIIEFNVIGSNVSLTKNNDFYVPAMENNINFLNSKFNFLNTSLKDIGNMSSALQVSGGPRSNAQSFSMRGFDKNGVAFLVDDIPVSFLSQHINFIPIDLTNISSANVIRGPFSAIYGSNALGGVISLKSFSSSDLLQPNKKTGSFIRTGFSSGNKQFSITASSYGKTYKSDFLGSISFTNSKDIKSGNNNQINMPERNKEISSMLKGRYFLDNNKWLSASYYLNLNNSTIPANPEQNLSNNFLIKNINHKINVQNHLIRLSYNIDGNEGLSPNMLSMLYFNYLTQKETPEEDFTGGTFYKKGQKLGKENYIVGGKHIEDITFNLNNYINNLLVYGADYKYQKQNKNNTDPRGLIANAYSNNLGLFLQNDASITKLFNITTAIRYDYFYFKQSDSNNSNPYNQISPKISLTYKPYEPFMTYISYGRAFRTPNLNEIYASGLHYAFGDMTNYLIPNPSLKPATSDTIEAGYGFKFKNLPISAELELKNAVYYTFVKDYISLTMGRATSQYTNVDKVRMTGIDLSTNYKNKYFKTEISYNYIKAIDRNTNANLMNISSNTFKLNYEQNIINTGFFVGYNFRAQSSFNICKTEPGMGSYACSLGTVKMPGFVTHDIYTGFTKKNTKVAFIISNLADKLYYDTFAGLPSAGRSYKVFITIKI